MQLEEKREKIYPEWALFGLFRVTSDSRGAKRGLREASSEWLRELNAMSASKCVASHSVSVQEDKGNIVEKRADRASETE